MIVIIGTGAVAAEVTMFISGLKQIKGYLEYEDNRERYYEKYHYEKPVIGDIDSYSICKDDEFIIAIGDVQFRRVMFEKMKSMGGKFINFIDPTCIVSPDIKIGEGNIISPYCLIDPNVEIGDFNLLTAFSAISHDSTLGNNNFLSSSVICGNVNIGNDNFFGVHSSVIPYMYIGNYNKIQAGSAVSKNMSDNQTFFMHKGNPTII